MILHTTRKENAALTLHMQIMRKSFNNLLKARYKSSKSEYKTAYDYVHSEFKRALETGNDITEVYLNIIDVNVLKAFIRAYTDQIDKQIKDMQQADIEQVDLLRTVNLKCEDLLSA